MWTCAVRQMTIQVMEERPAAESPPLGYAVVLIGALGFVVGCFLPYAEARTPHSWSLYRLLTTKDEAVAVVGAYLDLFAGAAVIALISLAAMKKPRTWAFPALAAASTVWSLTWIAFFLFGYGFYTSLNSGFWLMAFSVAVVVIGTILVGPSIRPRERR
jgi:hypothetical protein